MRVGLNKSHDKKTLLVQQIEHFWCQNSFHGAFYYKHVTIVNDDPSVVSNQSFKLIDDPRVVIYDCHRFIIQATGYLKMMHKTYYLKLKYQKWQGLSC